MVGSPEGLGITEALTVVFVEVSALIGTDCDLGVFSEPTELFCLELVPYRPCLRLGSCPSLKTPSLV